MATYNVSVKIAPTNKNLKDALNPSPNTSINACSKNDDTTRNELDVKREQGKRVLQKNAANISEQLENLDLSPKQWQQIYTENTKIQPQNSTNLPRNTPIQALAAEIVTGNLSLDKVLERAAELAPQGPTFNMSSPG